MQNFVTASATSYATRNRQPFLSRMPVWLVLLLIIAGVMILGLLWVRKENYHEELAQRFTALDDTIAAVLTEQGHLQTKYLSLTESTVIESLARSDLQMTFPEVPPDTVRVPARLIHRDFPLPEPPRRKGITR